jgi:hypothetical protein
MIPLLVLPIANKESATKPQVPRRSFHGIDRLVGHLPDARGKDKRLDKTTDKLFPST